MIAEGERTAGAADIGGTEGGEGATYREGDQCSERFRERLHKFLWNSHLLSQPFTDDYEQNIPRGRSAREFGNLKPSPATPGEDPTYPNVLFRRP